ncbi:MAG: hypothetical protein A2Y50_09065 [Pseudomonadales bacterium RIFCSPLOWO2_12_59_9]|nr:MAG: hypothetical protein A2Y50_09065 [Pseudomonadales bacterium RIFCSPLOWO2_12_59_9]
MSIESKDPAEIITVTFPYAKEIGGATILNEADPGANPDITVEITNGTDSGAAQMLNGALQISTSNVLQSVKTGLDGVDYKLRCEAPLSDGRKLVRVLPLPVRRK